MMRKPSKKVLWIIVFTLAGLLGFLLLFLNIQRRSVKDIYTRANEMPVCYTALILGAHVNEAGRPSVFLQDRLDAGIELYRAGKIKRFLLSGDHGTKGYDEVNNMKQYLLSRKVDTSDIFLDHAGFDTYNSLVRAKKVFLADRLIIVTQQFHLPRALFIARNQGIEAYGYVADKQDYPGMGKLAFREQIAWIKAIVEVTLNRSPKYLGEVIPITGDSRLSYD